MSREGSIILGYLARKIGVGIQTLALVAGIAVVAYAADIWPNSWTTLWPLNGFTVSALLIQPRRRWPLIMCGVVTGTYFGEISQGSPWAQEVWIRCLSVTEVLVTASLLPRFRTLEDWLDQPRFFRRLSIALLAGPGGTGLIAMLVYHAIDGRDYFSAFNYWATADALGIVTMMPLVFTLLSRETYALFRRDRLLKTLATLGFAFAVSTLIFYESRVPILFVLFPVILLVDLILGFSGSVITVAWVCTIAASLTSFGYGPFANAHLDSRTPNFPLQLYLGFHILILFPASIMNLERRRMNEALRAAHADMTRLAVVDGLTGVANRRALDQALEREWRRGLRERGSLGLLMVDVDHFKEYNDALGHQAGDVCLVAVAAAINAQAKRAADVVARYGGEEFAVLLPGACPDETRRVADNVINAISGLGIRHPTRGQVTASIGCCALRPSADAGSAALLRQADLALYAAKQGGRNQVQSGGAPGLSVPHTV